MAATVTSRKMMKKWPTFFKRMNKGIDSRYRGKLPLICFNCDGIGHFSNKFPHKKKRNDEGY